MKNSVYWKLSAFFFVYFFSWLVFFAFLPIWFGQKLQLSGMQIGTIYSGNAIFSMVLQPFYGYLSDKIGMKRYLLGKRVSLTPRPVQTDRGIRK